MAQKHKSYVPQQRPVRQSVIESAPTREVEQAPVASYKHLAQVMDASDDWMNEGMMNSLAAHTYAKFMVIQGAQPGEKSVQAMSETSLLFAAASLMHADKLFLDNGFDLGSDPALFTGASRAQRQNMSRSIEDAVATIFTDESNGDNTEKNQLLKLSILTFAGTFIVNSKAASEALMEHGHSRPYEKYRESVENLFTDEQLEALDWLTQIRYAALKENPSRARRMASETLLALRNPELAAFIESELGSTQGPVEQQIDEPVQAEIFGGQELDFTILPRGTNLREYTEEIYEGLSARDREYVDLKRVETLEKIREIMGPERTYYVHGVAREKNNPDVQKNYVGLVIQNHDAKGQVVSEDALAVSPVAGKDAGYFFRSDYSTETSWRETLSLSKEAARAKGARPLKFTEVRGRDKYDAYVQKATELLTCPPHQFAPTFQLYFSERTGEYRLKERKVTDLGRSALIAASR